MNVGIRSLKSKERGRQPYRLENSVLKPPLRPCFNASWTRFGKVSAGNTADFSTEQPRYVFKPEGVEEALLDLVLKTHAY
jgi:hypothetical protein